MPEPALGKLISKHSTSPVFLQRAAVVAVVSFLFFLVMLLAFYIRQQIGYFILSTAFLVVYLFTLVGWLMQKRNTVGIYENGLRYGKFITSWSEIKSVTANKKGMHIEKTRGETAFIPSSVSAYESINRAVKLAVESTK